MTQEQRERATKEFQHMTDEIMKAVDNEQFGKVVAGMRCVNDVKVFVTKVFGADTLQEIIDGIK